MSELEALVVAFQAQLSAVMETAVKTAMFEVSRLMEEVVFVEVRRRDEELEALRLQLQWTEKNQSEGGGRKCVDCGRGRAADGEPLEERGEGGGLVKNEDEQSVENWMSSCEDEFLPGSSRSTEREEGQVTQEEEEEVMEIKEEDVETPLHVGPWIRAEQKDEAQQQSSEMDDAAQEDSDQVLKSVLMADAQQVRNERQQTLEASQQLLAHTDDEPLTHKRQTGTESEGLAHCEPLPINAEKSARESGLQLGAHTVVYGPPAASVRSQVCVRSSQRAHRRLRHVHSSSAASPQAAPPSPPPPAVTLHRHHTPAAAVWPGVKSHYQSGHGVPALRPGSPPPTGPRHFLRCVQCGRSFSHPSNLKAHLHIHTGERPFSCSLCGRTFTKHSNLKAHRRVHTGERPYCCPACGKRFTQKCNLKRHQRIHLDG